MGSGQFGIDPDTVARVAKEIAGIAKDHELCLVVGGGNIFRGLAAAAKGAARAALVLRGSSVRAQQGRLPLVRLAGLRAPL